MYCFCAAFSTVSSITFSTVSYNVSSDTTLTDFSTVSSLYFCGFFYCCFYVFSTNSTASSTAISSAVSSAVYSAVSSAVSSTISSPVTSAADTRFQLKGDHAAEVYLLQLILLFDALRDVRRT